MTIIIAHEETCDIVVHGPTQDAELGMLLDGTTLVGQVASACTCGGVRYRVGSSTEGGAHLYCIENVKEANNG